ncbi:cupin domain-containing protein, partial [Acinetobacter baumannii]|uniref:cupin domain-containing protein n=1 Tax=Acinetobacter baumannii TaxID=470 RepID=UPI0011140165
EVVPAGHPVVTVATNDKNLLIVSFEINAENNVKYQLAGGRNVLNQLKKEAKELVFNVPARVVEELFGKNKKEGVLPGPRQQQEEGRAYA